ncbi:MAG: hypothetical protein ACT443_03210 [Gemmatimonadota bacterium]
MKRKLILPLLSAFSLCSVLCAPLMGQVVVPVPACGDAVSQDDDQDGLSNTCELSLARSVAPILVVRATGCNWNEATARLGGGYLFAAQPVDAAVRVAYLPAYFRDCGWRGAKCWLPGVDCSPHAGDSEFIVVELTDTGGQDWTVSGVFLSAHCFGRSGESCRWYRGHELGSFEFAGAQPVVWVSEGRNANYASKRECDGGHHSLDTCDHQDHRYAFPIDPLRNLGSKAFPAGQRGCVSGSELEDTSVDSNVVECFWRPDRRFGGWQKDAPGVTGYFRYLTEIAGF